MPLKGTTVEPLVSDHPKRDARLCGRLGRRLLTKIETQEISSDKRSRHFSFLAENALCAISKLRIGAVLCCQ